VASSQRDVIRGETVRVACADLLSDFRDGMIGDDGTFMSWAEALNAVGLEG
jgi:hypothetical protein